MTSLVRLRSIIIIQKNQRGYKGRTKCNNIKKNKYREELNKLKVKNAIIIQKNFRR